MSVGTSVEGTVVRTHICKAETISDFSLNKYFGRRARSSQEHRLHGERKEYSDKLHRRYSSANKMYCVVKRCATHCLGETIRNNNSTRLKSVKCIICCRGIYVSINSIYMLAVGGLHVFGRLLYVGCRFTLRATIYMNTYMSP